MPPLANSHYPVAMGKKATHGGDNMSMHSVVHAPGPTLQRHRKPAHLKFRASPYPVFTLPVREKGQFLPPQGPRAIGQYSYGSRRHGQLPASPPNTASSAPHLQQLALASAPFVPSLAITLKEDDLTAILQYKMENDSTGLDASFGAAKIPDQDGVFYRKGVPMTRWDLMHA